MSTFWCSERLIERMKSLNSQHHQQTDAKKYIYKYDRVGLKIPISVTFSYCKVQATVPLDVLTICITVRKDRIDLKLCNHVVSTSA